MRERRQFLNCRCYVMILIFKAVPALCHAYSSSGAATGKKETGHQEQRGVSALLIFLTSGNLVTHGHSPRSRGAVQHGYFIPLSCPVLIISIYIYLL